MNPAVSIPLLALGAGQQVGRSCILTTLGDKTIMFDCGIHMLYSDHRRYPDFASLYNAPSTINSHVHLVLLTHFHLDHCGGLPFLTEVHGYNGKIIASTPTKAMIPYMLEDYRKVTSSEVKKEENKKEEIGVGLNTNSSYVYTSEQVKNACSKVQSIGLFESVVIDGIKITSYYAGHVLGACMFHVEYAGLSVLYTGDYNSYADRHLGAASLPALHPNLIITETTYATTIRDSKRDRQRTMLKVITQTLEGGGKVLIPVFALGRAQQLAVLLETYWKRTQSNVPVYFSAGLIQKANVFYKLFVQWENEKIKEEFEHGENVFSFSKVKPFDKSLIRSEMPYVLFATPGMLHAGTSMQVFKEWCHDPKNTLIIPGYCVQGTLGNKLLKGVKQVILDRKSYEVKMKIVNVSFSAHADAKGIINLIRGSHAESIVFVHGDKVKMQSFATIVEEQLKRKVYMPANGLKINIPATKRSEIAISNTSNIYPKGYLLKSPVSNSFTLIKQEQLLEEVNRMMLLMGDQSGLIIDEHIDCQFSMPILKQKDRKIIEELSNKYKDVDIDQKEELKIENQGEIIKMEENNEEDKVKSQKQNIELNGNLTNITSFLRSFKNKSQKE